ncbi:hypothetical protein B0H66DRAFT_255015 [Apodospora peruviana]|uniref:Uncharacterized protein n=1 Tax=Apodospora peruviana TaxID=516989 RepID=A0AAE0I6H3_9PEZI|nr:hypothetical protein B0H66DRAFT_255015 [Apodospora peruviana]
MDYGYRILPTFHPNFASNINSDDILFEAKVRVNMMNTALAKAQNTPASLGVVKDPGRQLAGSFRPRSSRTEEAPVKLRSCPCTFSGPDCTYYVGSLSKLPVHQEAKEVQRYLLILTPPRLFTLTLSLVLTSAAGGVTQSTGGDSTSTSFTVSSTLDKLEAFQVVFGGGLPFCLASRKWRLVSPQTSGQAVKRKASNRTTTWELSTRIRVVR